MRRASLRFLRSITLLLTGGDVLIPCARTVPPASHGYADEARRPLVRKPQASGTTDKPLFKPEELEQIVAPIALCGLAIGASADGIDLSAGDRRSGALVESTS